ncbi:MAG: SPW repeat protein [Gemmatimonadota bacterium]|nr:SPW repeat protein [Gemmatimonadota bacterium]
MKHPREDGQQQMHEHGQMMQRRHQRELWANFATVALGLWLAASPFSFDYQDSVLVWNDVICGLLIAVFGFLSISYERGWARWANCAIGIWLLFVPLVFWAPTPVAYVTETLIGTLVIAFSILVPGMPGMRMMPGPDVPPGWSYNPSSWVQRAPVIALGLISFFIARYLAAYQLGYIDHAWDPFFDDSTVRVLDSKVSRAWPVSDAGFGALAYMLEALSGFMGQRNRWRTMPWMVLMFGVLVIPLGITSIALVIMQPVMVGAWCTLCLITALFMLIMIPLSVDEVAAMARFMVKTRHQGKPFWINFWRGGTPDPENTEEDTTTFHAPPTEVATTMVWGVTAPWNLLVSTALGFWLMATPAVFGSAGSAADSSHLVGPLVAVVAVSAMAEIIRSLRLVNVLAGAWLIAAPWLLAGSTTGSALNDVVIGAALIALSLPRGSILQRYGGWDRLTR